MWGLIKEKLHSMFWKRQSLWQAALLLLFLGSISLPVVYAENLQWGRRDFISIETGADIGVSRIEASLLPHFSQTGMQILFIVLGAALIFFMGLSWHLWRQQGVAERRALAEMHSARKKTFELGENYTRQMNGMFYKSTLDGIGGPLGEIMKLALKLHNQGVPAGDEIYENAGRISQFLLNVHRLNRLSMGKEKLQTEPVVCHKFIGHHLQRLQKIAEGRGMQFRSQYPSNQCQRKILLDHRTFSQIFIRLTNMMLKDMPDGAHFSVSVMVPEVHNDRSALWITLSAPDLRVSDMLFNTASLLFNEERREEKNSFDTFVRVRQKLSLKERAVMAELLVLERLLSHMGGRWSFHRERQYGVVVDMEFFVDLV